MNSIKQETTVPPSVFKAYDIRGLFEEDLTPDHAYLIGRGFARVIAKLAGKTTASLKLGIGHDMRLSSPLMAERFCQGVLEEGSSVISIGEVATEMLYYLVGSRGLDGGAMITASHNPKQYTGMKLVREGALALSGDEGIQNIRQEIEQGFPASDVAPTQVEKIDIYTEFQEKASSFINTDSIKELVRPLRVVVDGGNGMAGPMVGPILDGLGVELIKIYWQPDGNFPDHEPNPLLEENRQAIIKRVVAERADLGIAWDGDADRCFFIDELGNFIDGDFLTALLAEAVIKSNPGANILYDVRASRAVVDTVTKAGGTAHINRVGHAFFKGRMRKEGALFGGEVSGHYYFKDFYCADSGTLPALLILERLAKEGKSLSELLKPYRDNYFISGEINSTVDDPKAKIEEVTTKYADGKQTSLDGISVDYPDWHFNVRASNTEPLLRLNLESLISPEHMQKKRDEVLALIRS